MKECTDGEYPCEMHGYIASVESENIALKDFLRELLSALNPQPNIEILSAAILKKIADYPDFIRDREMIATVPLSKQCRGG